jgi:hypothetical protein
VSVDLRLVSDAALVAELQRRGVLPASWCEQLSRAQSTLRSRPSMRSDVEHSYGLASGHDEREQAAR